MKKKTTKRSDPKNLTWPLQEKLQQELFGIIMSTLDVHFSVEDVRFQEIPIVSSSLRMFQLFLKEGEIDSPLYAYCGVNSVDDFLLVDKESGAIYLDAATGYGLGESIRDIHIDETPIDSMFNICSLSYSALAKLLNQKLPKDGTVGADVIFKLFKTCDFSVVDYSPDQILYRGKDSKEVKSVLAMQTKDTEAGVENDISAYRYNGFNCDGVLQHKTKFYNKGEYVFHKPSTVLVKKNVKGEKTSDYGEEFAYFVFGVDEGTYFGCALSRGYNPKTVKEAFLILVPSEFRSSVDKLLRQGEWFFRRTGNVPKDTHTFVQCDEGFSLPRKSATSNFHRVYGTVFVRYLSEGLIEIVANEDTIVSSDDHADLVLKTGVWEIRENTAKLSVSEEGVD